MELNIDASDFNKTLAPWIGLTYKMMNQYIADELFKNNIQVTKQQWIILKILQEKNDEVIQNDLAFITNRNKASLTRLISLMEKNNLVYRAISKEDARKNLIFSTETGKKLFEQMKPLMITSIKNIQKGLTEDDILQLIKTLSKIQHNIKIQSL
jgi:DNA-binding MarR family transcriptional regulator